MLSQKVWSWTLCDKKSQSTTKSCSGPHGYTFYLSYKHFTNNIDLLLSAFNKLKFYFQVSANSSDKGFNVSIFNSFHSLTTWFWCCFLQVFACFNFISCCRQFNFCQFLFLSSLCKLSFHPEMEFSFMLKLLLSCCQDVLNRTKLYKITHKLLSSNPFYFYIFLFLIFVSHF